MEKREESISEVESKRDIEIRIKWATTIAWWLVGIGFTIGLIGVVVTCKDGFTLTNLSSLGSYLQGTVASFWALAGFLLIYATFLAQRQQFRLQSQEFEASQQQQKQEQSQQQEAVEAQKKQFEIQRKAIGLQNFRDTFFELLGIHNQIVTSMNHRHTFEGEAKGRDCFERLHRLFNEFQVTQRVPGGAFAPKQTTFTEKYAAFYEVHRHMLGHYFTNLYNIFNFINDSDIEDKTKQTFASLAGALLSQFELFLLFFHGLTIIPPEIENKFKPLIEKFRLLANLDQKKFQLAEYIGFYKPEALR
jgi:hypothetical protein